MVREINPFLLIDTPKKGEAIASPFFGVSHVWGRWCLLQNHPAQEYLYGMMAGTNQFSKMILSPVRVTGMAMTV